MSLMSDTPKIDAARDAVIASIVAAFVGVGRGDGVTLHEADVIDGYGSDEMRREARKLDPETRWQDVPEADIEHYHWALSFFDAEGFRYYIPAYMTWTLRYAETSDSISADYTIYAFTHTPPNDDRQFALLDNVQRRAIVASCAFSWSMTRTATFQICIRRKSR